MIFNSLLFICQVSVHSPVSITSVIQNTYPTASTGNAIEYTAVSGAFNGAPLGSNNLADTLEGQYDITMFEYPDWNATVDLFIGAYPTVVEAVPPTFATMATNMALVITLAQPEDQDFSIMKILEVRLANILNSIRCFLKTQKFSGNHIICQTCAETRLGV